MERPVLAFNVRMKKRRNGNWRSRRRLFCVSTGWSVGREVGEMRELSPHSNSIAERELARSGRGRRAWVMWGGIRVICFHIEKITRPE